MTTQYQLIIKNNIDTIQDILLEIPLQQIDKIIITQLQNHKISSSCLRCLFLLEG
mgnify:CR=1 FL=1